MMQKMAKAFNRFAKKEDGLVTVEWVSLAAAVVVGGIAIAWAILGSINTADIGGQIATQQGNAVGTLPANPFSAP